MEDLTSMADSVSKLLIQRKQTVAVSESAAGGLISAALLSIPGASAYFVGGGVIYTRDARRSLLGFSRKEAVMRGASEEYALIAARAIREILGADWGLSETGTAGPTGNRYGDDPGHACFAVSGPVEKTITFENEEPDRETNMWAFAEFALDLLDEVLTKFTGVVIVYGLKNCDTCRAALKWMRETGVKHQFHDISDGGLNATTLNGWIGDVGWDALLNRRNATWRQLPEAVRENTTPVSAATLMLAKPTLVKRPVFDLGGQVLVGFTKTVREALQELRQ